MSGVLAVIHVVMELLCRSCRCEIYIVAYEQKIHNVNSCPPPGVPHQLLGYIPLCKHVNATVLHDIRF